MTSYRIVEGPLHINAPEGSLLTGYYRAVFEDELGASFTRYLTDEDRAEVIRLQDMSEPRFSPEDLERLTVEPDLHAVLARFDAEAGQGA